MKEKLEQILASVRENLEHANSLPALDELWHSLMGKKGELTQILKGLGALKPEERPAVGQMVNETRQAIENMLNDAKKRLMQNEQNARLATETLDVTMPGKRRAMGRRHPMTVVINELTDMFMGMGYEIAEGPDVETDYYNFEALNIPANHPTRDEQATFYTEGGPVLRTQTSGVQVRTMERVKPPIKIVAPGTCYRSDQVDATHSPVFHQIEGLVVDRNITMGDLKGALELFARELFGSDTKVRFRPHHFPFTEPSAEVDVSCFACGGKGCRVCKDSGWIELLGCGMVHPRVLEMSGIDPMEYSGFAFGMGLERIAMARFGISDMRLLFENDVRFLKQF